MRKVLPALLVGLVAGSCAMQPAAADKVDHTGNIATECHGNGAGGYRQCRVFVTGNPKKIRLGLFVNGEWQMTTQLALEPGGTWRVVP